MQKPHPPIYLAAFSPQGLKRAATQANGWNPAVVPLDGMKPMMEALKGFAQEAERNPSEVEVVVRGFLNVTEKPLDDDRPIFNGSLEQTNSDIAAIRELGVDELFFDLQFSPEGTSVDGILSRMEKMRKLV